MAKPELKTSQKYSSQTVFKKKAKINAYLKKGKQLKTEEKLNQAIEQYQHALQLNPEGLQIINYLAIIMEQKFSWD